MSKQGNYLKLQQVSQTFLTWQSERYSVKDAPPDVFDAWIRQYVETILNVDTFQWDIFDRWQIINAVLDVGILVIHSDTLEHPSIQLSEEKSSELIVSSEEKSSVLHVEEARANR